MAIDPGLTGTADVIGIDEYFLPAGDGTIWLIGHPHSLPGHRRDGGATGKTRGQGRRRSGWGRSCVSARLRPNAFPSPRWRLVRYLFRPEGSGLGLIDIESGAIAERISKGRSQQRTRKQSRLATSRVRPSSSVMLKLARRKKSRRPEPLEFAPTYESQFSPDGSLLATTVFVGPPNREKRFPHQDQPRGRRDRGSRDWRNQASSSPTAIRMAATGDSLRHRTANACTSPRPLRVTLDHATASRAGYVRSTTSRRRRPSSCPSTSRTRSPS